MVRLHANPKVHMVYLGLCINFCCLPLIKFYLKQFYFICTVLSVIIVLKLTNKSPAVCAGNDI